MGTYNVHAGHNPSGMIACGAQGLLNESVENRLIAGEMIRLLRESGNTAYDCTVNDGISQKDVLSKIIEKCNEHDVDFDFSVHFNAGKNDYSGDGSIGGFEIWVTDTGKGKGEIADCIRTNMKALGFTDRGTKTTSGLYVLNKTKAPALLLEICFVDDADDYNLYKNVGYMVIAKAIVNGIIQQTESRMINSETMILTMPASGAMMEKKPSAYVLIVDGKWGPATTRRMQQILGIIIDGKISNQPETLKNNNPGLLASAWEFIPNISGTKGSQLIVIMQKMIGVVEDGFMGVKTIIAMQKWLGTIQDGHVSNPSAMVKALQKWCNEQ